MTLMPSGKMLAKNLGLSAVLTERQWDILRLRAKGLATKEIALLLALSEHTVKNHLTAAFRILDVNSSIGAFRKLGWLRLPGE